MTNEELDLIHSNEKITNPVDLDLLFKTSTITPCFDIYVYMGIITKDDTKYYLFKDLEVNPKLISSITLVPEYSYDIFIKKHNIIFNDDMLNINRYFNDLQKKFFNELIFTSKKDALENVKKIYNRK